MVEKAKTQLTPSLLGYLIYFVSVNNLLKLSYYYNEYPSPPSDSVVYGVGILTVAFLNWNAISYKNCHLHKVAQSFIDNHLLFSWSIKMAPINHKKSGYLKRSSMLGKYSKEKNFHLDNKMGMIGQLERMFFRALKVQGDKCLLTDLSVPMNEFDGGLKLEKILDTFDIFDILSGARIPSFENSSVTIDNVEAILGDEGAYVT